MNTQKSTSQKPTIYKPKNGLPFPNQHAGDTFREIIDLWKKNGYVNVVETDNPHVWLNAIGDVLLYDRPTLDWLPKDLKYNTALFGNPSPVGNTSNSSNWIFWPRSPKILEQYAANEQMFYHQRPFESIFIGNIENNVQQKYREVSSPDAWKKVIAKFELTNGKTHKYNQREYLHLLQRAKFGLCLRGFGPKCNRDIELLALGVVPLVTSDVSLDYFDPLIEGLHYLRINGPEDVPKVIAECSKEQWEAMSLAGREWYWRNASTEGSFKTTMKIANRYKLEQQKVQSISTMASIGSWNDLDVLLKSLSVFNPEIPVYIATDEATVEKLMNSDHKNTLTLKIVNCLDEYTGKDRKQMESEGLWLEFMLRKCDAIDVALTDHDNTLFVDSDMCFLNPIDHSDFDYSKDIGRSYHSIKEYNEKMYGKYNGGFVFVNHNSFTNIWKLLSNGSSRYFEQACLEDMDKIFTTFDVPIEYNYGWWRLFECPENQFELRKKLFNVQGDSSSSGSVVVYNNKPLRCIHTHFDSNFIHTVNFNNFIVNELLSKLPETSKTSQVSNFILERFPNTIKSNAKKTVTPVAVTSSEEDTLITISNSYAADNGIHLIFQYCNTTNIERQREYDACVLANLNNPKISKIYNMKESNVIVPGIIAKHSKYQEVACDHWLKFRDAFEYANTHLIGKVVGISNLDIFLDSTGSNWENLGSFLPENNVVLCLSRHEFDGVSKASRDPNLQALAYANCQDAWFFKSPIFVSLEKCDFEIGRPGCDNAIAHRIKSSGYIPWNPSNEYKIFHYDICRGKTGANYLQKTYEEESRKNKNVFPEEDGCYLLPDKDTIKSVDQVVNGLKLNDFQKYEIICDVMSKYIKINNRPPIN